LMFQNERNHFCFSGKTSGEAGLKAIKYISIHK
jgi:hypothetical protein